MRVVRVLPDVSGINKAFDYYVPDHLAGPPIRIGSLVRVKLHGRRTAGWVVDVDVEPPANLTLEPLLKSSSVGPGREVVALAEWVGHEWAGRWSAVLKTASPDRFVQSVPPLRSATVAAGPQSGLGTLFAGEGPRIVRSPPAADRFELIREAGRRGSAIVVAPDQKTAAAHAGRLTRAGIRTHRYPDDWSGGFAGGVVLGRGPPYSPPSLTSHRLLFSMSMMTLWPTNATPRGTHGTWLSSVPSERGFHVCLSRLCPALRRSKQPRMCELLPEARSGRDGPWYRSSIGETTNLVGPVCSALRSSVEFEARGGFYASSIGRDGR